MLFKSPNGKWHKPMVTLPPTSAAKPFSQESSFSAPSLLLNQVLVYLGHSARSKDPGASSTFSTCGVLPLFLLLDVSDLL